MDVHVKDPRTEKTFAMAKLCGGPKSGTSVGYTGFDSLLALPGKPSQNSRGTDAQ